MPAMGFAATRKAMRKPAAKCAAWSFTSFEGMALRRATRPLRVSRMFMVLSPHCDPLAGVRASRAAGDCRPARRDGGDAMVGVGPGVGGAARTDANRCSRERFREGDACRCFARHR